MTPEVVCAVIFGTLATILAVTTILQNFLFHKPIGGKDASPPTSLRSSLLIVEFRQTLMLKPNGHGMVNSGSETPMVASIQLVHLINPPFPVTSY